MNKTLKKIFEDDQADRTTNNIDWSIITPRDEKRRQVARKILSSEVKLEGSDYYHAAMLFQHGNMISEYKLAQKLSRKAANMGYLPAKWLYTAATDRILVNQNKLQKFGTQYRLDKNGIHHIESFDPKTTDLVRSKFNVPPLGKNLLRDSVWKEFYDSSLKSDVVWIGETHGVKENYQAYKIIIDFLSQNHAWEIAIEYPLNDQLPVNDGRVNRQSKTFQRKFKITHFFEGEISGQEREIDMAKKISNLSFLKLIVITGSYHSQLRQQKSIKPAAQVFTEITGKKVLTLGLAYFGGSFYNFGVKRFTKKHLHYSAQKFGVLEKSTQPLLTDKFWFNVGTATPVDL